MTRHPVGRHLGGLARGVRHLRRMSRQLARSVALWAAAGFLFAVALIFLVLAGFLALLRVFDPPVAALLTAVALLLLGWILTALAGRTRHPASREPDEDPAPEEEAAFLPEDIDRWADDGRRMIRRNPFGMTAGAIAAGLLVGGSPRVRRAIRRVLQ